jgi:hypothetical protein
MKVSQQGKVLFAVSVESLRAAYEDSFPAAMEEILQPVS